VKKTKSPILPPTKTKKTTVTSDKPAEKATGAKPKSSEDVTSAAKKLKTVKDIIEKKGKKAKQPESDHEDEAEAENEDTELSEDDDQTAAFLEGFEESDDEEAEEGEPFEPGTDIPTIDIPKKSKKQLKKIAEAAAAEKPGVLFVGRIPHGFYEHEMNAYFSQFGNILKLRLSRNRKTGASKHYAWIQFESAAVAEIVAKTMDNYLLFKHILKVKIVPDEQVPENLFKGANKRFKKVPWNKIEGRKLEQGASEEVWEKRIEKEDTRRTQKAEKLKALGYEFEAPKIKSAKGVGKKPLAITEIEEASDDEEPKAIEAASKPKDKKAKKGKAVTETAEVVSKTTIIEAAPSVVEDVSKPRDRKGKKSKAAKETVVEESAPDVEELSKVTTSTTFIFEEVPEKKPKSKKSKKSKSTLIEEATVAEEVLEQKVKAKKSKTTIIEAPELEVAVPEKKVKAKKSSESLIGDVDVKTKKSKKEKKSKV